MIEEYKSKIEYHKKMVAHFEGLISTVEKLNNSKEWNIWYYCIDYNISQVTYYYICFYFHLEGFGC